jgi:hypothetical protein
MYSIILFIFSDTEFLSMLNHFRAMANPIKLKSYCPLGLAQVCANYRPVLAIRGFGDFLYH